MNLKRYYPHCIAVVIFVVITFIQFKPLFSGKVINQSDIIQYKGMSKEVTDFRNTQHSEPLWTNSMFGGMPAYQVSTLYPGNWLSSIDKLFHLFLPHPSGYIFMCFFGFFILLLCLQINPWLALVGSLAYGFSSYFYIVLEVGHNSKANAIGYLAPLLGGIILLLRGKYWLGFALTTLFMALELNANHVQITYYGFMVFALVFASYFMLALKEKALNAFFKALLFFVVASVIGVLPNAGNLLSTYEYGNYTTRGKTELSMDANLQSNAANKTSGLDKDYAVQYSYGMSESFSFLIPNYKGGASSAAIGENAEALKKVDPEMREQVAQFGSYFGEQDYIAGPVYVGAIVILLALLGLLIIHHPLKWPLFIATVLSISLAWGKYFMGLSSFFMDYLPGYNKFRAVSIINIIAELTLPLLAVMALDALIKAQAKKQVVKLPFLKTEMSLKKAVIVCFAIVGGFCTMGILVPTAVNSFSPQNEEAKIANRFEQSGASKEQVNQIMPELMANLIIAREAIFKSDATRSFIFILLAFASIFLFLTDKIKKEFLLLGVGVLFVADLWPVVNRYLNTRSFVPKAQFEAPPLKTRADEQILQDKSLDYRVLNLDASPFQDAQTSYYHKSIGGYHGAKLKKYQEIIEFHLVKEFGLLDEGLRVATNDSSQAAAFSKLNVLNMLNTKYVIFPTKEEPLALINTQANGNAWFVKEIKTVADADSEIVALYHLNTKTAAVIQEKNKGGTSVASTYGKEGSISLKSYQPNDLVYDAETKEKGFAVFSEIYYPKGWNAYVDGTLTPYVCVDYLLRGMEIPAGKHQIEFKFEPKIYKTGNSIALVGSILVLLSVGFGLFMSNKKEHLGQ
jgi:hypothetical protein